MPPAIEDYDYGGQTRVPIQAPKGAQPTRRGVISEGQRYSSPYAAVRDPSTGSATPSQSVGPSSHSHGYQSTLRGPYSEAEPAFNVTLNPAPRPPMQQQRQSYSSSSPRSQYGAPPLSPYQVQRSPQYQAQRSAQSALGTFPHPGQQVPYLAIGRAQQVYQKPQPRLPHPNGSGHGHDFTQPQHEAQYRSGQQPTSGIPYHSPYYSGPLQSFPPSPYPPRQQEYSSTPMQVAVPMYRHVQYQPSLSQHIPRSTESSVYPESSPSPAPSSGTPRRGRPPTKGKTNKPSKLAIELISSPMTTKKRGRPSRNAQGTPPINYVSASAGLGSGAKKRGRPFKSAEAATKAQEKANGTYTPKKRGRPMRMRHQPEVLVPRAEYVGFLCEWMGCKAELHNLETLMKHVIIIHGRKTRDLVRVCGWGKCGMKSEEIDENDELLGDPDAEMNKEVFTSKKDWMKHIEEKHLVPFSWHMGDGPKATSFEVKDLDVIDPWLLDKDGRQVTPSIENQTIEAGIARVNNLKRWNKEMKKLNLSMNSEAPTGSFMKTQAQIVQEENAEEDTGTGTGSGEGEGEGEAGGSTGDDMDDNDADNDQGEMDDGKQVERRLGSESRGGDSDTDLMILDSL